MKLSSGKLAGLKKVSNPRGVIAAAAMDQRGSLQKALAKERGSEITTAMMEEFKVVVSQVLTLPQAVIPLFGGPLIDALNGPHGNGGYRVVFSSAVRRRLPKEWPSNEPCGKR